MSARAPSSLPSLTGRDASTLERFTVGADTTAQRLVVFTACPERRLNRSGCGARGSRTGRIWNRELAADFAGKVLSDLEVAWNSLNRAGLGVYPKRAFAALTLETAAVSLQVPEQITAFHQTRIEVCSAPRGAFSRPCSRRYSKTSSIAAARL